MLLSKWSVGLFHSKGSPELSRELSEVTEARAKVSHQRPLGNPLHETAPWQSQAKETNRADTMKGLVQTNKSNCNGAVIASAYIKTFQ